MHRYLTTAWWSKLPQHAHTVPQRHTLPSDQLLLAMICFVFRHSSKHTEHRSPLAGRRCGPNMPAHPLGDTNSLLTGWSVISSSLSFTTMTTSQKGPTTAVLLE